MNLKTTVLVLTLSTLTGLSTAYAADAAEKPYYGSVRLGLVDQTGGSTDFANWNSRLGLKGETEVRPGVTAFGKYEIGVNVGGVKSGNVEADKDLETRHAFMGIKGKAGQVLIGKTEHTYYNLGLMPVDIANWASCNGCLDYDSRTTGISYSKSFGKFTVGAAHTMRNGADDKQKGNELGVAYKFSDAATVGLAGKRQNGGKTAIAANIGGSKGDFSYAAYLGKKDTVKGADIHLGYKRAYFTVGQIRDTSVNPTSKSTGATVGYNQPIGKNLTSWFEASRAKSDNGVSVTKTNTLRAAIQYDF